MQSFLDQLILELTGKPANLAESCVVFPTRRAGLIFKKKFSDHISKPTFLPVVFSIDDLISYLSPYHLAGATHLVLELFTCYKKLFPETQPAEFLPWGEMLLKDFNEVDLNLVNAEKLFAHVISLKEIDDLVGISEEETARIKQFWKLFSNQDLSRLQDTFLENWKSLPVLYHSFQQQLKQKNITYSGMAVRSVADGMANGTLNIPWKKIYFAGFYALSNAEKKLINHLTDKGLAEVFWDADTYYTEDKKQEAGKYFRKNQINQKAETLKWVGNYFGKEQKNIIISGIPLHVGQAKYTGNLLNENNIEHFNQHSTVVVLPDEKLLMPVLHSLPESIDAINVTMGYPLQGSPVEQMIRAIKSIRDHQEQEKTGYSFLSTDVVHFLENNYIFNLDKTKIKDLLWQVKQERSYGIPVSFFDQHLWHPVLGSIFNIRKDSQQVYEFLSDIVEKLLQHYQNNQKDINLFDFTLLNFFFEELKQLVKLVSEYRNEIDFNESTSWHFILSMLKSLRIPFTGEPVSGLQIMGFLETRNLDFENVFILSVNEDVMPGSSTGNSYIPFSIRKAYGLPTYEDQDAIYAYHFYRLLQRAKNIYLLYNSESGGMSGGEKSRYILQIAYEMKNKFPDKINLHHQLVGTDLKTIEVKPIRIQKKGELFTELNTLFFGESETKKKWSPTAFTTYITCPLQFYFKYLACIYEPEEIKQEIDPAVFGNIIHLVMEKFYAREKFISAEFILSLMPTIENDVDAIIRKLFPSGSGTLTGKNALLKAVMADLLRRILSRDKTETPFQIVSLEKEFSYRMKTAKGTILLSGKIDRVDEVNGVTRIIDYKTGSDKTSDKIILENVFSKTSEKATFQLLMYSFLYKKNNIEKKVKAGLYNLRTINRGIDFLNDGAEISDEQLNAFEEHLTRLIAEIVNPEIDFYQTTEVKNCEWCIYKNICNR